MIDLVEIVLWHFVERVNVGVSDLIKYRSNLHSTTLRFNGVNEDYEVAFRRRTLRSQ